jgi:hypothetical protein
VKSLSKRRYLFDPQKLVASSYDREDFIYGKRLVVMPLDIAMQMHNKSATNVDYTNYLCVLELSL